MTEQLLDHAHVGAGFEQVRREAVPQRVRGHASLEPCRGARTLHRLAHRRGVDRPAGVLADEEKRLRRPFLFVSTLAALRAAAATTARHARRRPCRAARGSPSASRRCRSPRACTSRARAALRRTSPSRARGTSATAVPRTTPRPAAATTRAAPAAAGGGRARPKDTAKTSRCERPWRPLATTAAKRLRSTPKLGRADTAYASGVRWQGPPRLAARGDLVRGG